MEITPSAIPMEDMTPEPDHSALVQGFQSIRIMKSWGGSESKQYIVGPPQYHNGRIVRLLTCLTTSRQMSVVEQDGSGEMSTETGDSVLIFVTENGERIVLHSETTQTDPKAAQSENEASQDSGNAFPAGGGFDSESKALYGRI